MKTLKLVQGEQNWHAHRRTARNASDAAAMLGLCKYKTRSQLLQEKATGIAAEVDDATQRRFDAGHAAEAAARAIAEEIIGDELFPCTATDDEGYLSASFDGINMMGTVCFEHKLANAALMETIRSCDPPDTHWPQLEQQLLISGADQVLFMCSDGTRENMVYTHYLSMPERRARLVEGWKQFDEDLKTYEYVAPKPVAVAEATDSLPTVSVRLDGQIAIISNLPEFGVALRTFIEKIPASPTTDQDFANCEAACKSLKKAEDALEASEAQALAQISDVDAMRRMVADLRNLARTTRLASEKQVASRKESLKVEIVANGKKALEQYIQQINLTLGDRYQLPAIHADFACAIKGKRTLSSMQEAVDLVLMRAKIDANSIRDNMLINIETLKAAGHSVLFPDAAMLALKANEDLKAIISSRIAEHEAAEAKKEAEQRERIRLEEEAKAQVDAKPEVKPEQSPPPAQLATSEPVTSQRPVVRTMMEELELWSINYFVSDAAFHTLIHILSTHGKIKEAA